jgi:hypothetical protein
MTTVRAAWRTILISILVLGGRIPTAATQTAAMPHSAKNSGCRVESINYKGWNAQQISNSWVRLVIVSQNGGRLMQVSFDGHDYLFVNPELAGKYMPPNQDHWFNYGGDKLWLLPEGDNDEQHWRGNSDLLDDGQFDFRILSDQNACGIALTGPPDPHSGVQFSRTIQLASDSPHIAFRASMKNISGHTIEWAMQSVSQYDTGNPADPTRGNGEIWGFTPSNPFSGYLNRYHVRTGPAENPSATVREDGMFALRYSHLASEFWVDSTADWLAVVNASSGYAMVERFQYQENKPYPGKASVIFWTNGPGLRFNDNGQASISEGGDGSPFYMEAEVNSPLCRLRPGESCQMDTDWYPTRAGSQFHAFSEAGIVTSPLAATYNDGKVKLSGSFGVFFPGKLVAHFYNQHGSATGTLALADVSPNKLIVLDQEISPQGNPARVSLHLEDTSGLDRGALQEIPIQTRDVR